MGRRASDPMDWQDKIDAVRKHFKTVAEHKDEQDYDRMRKAFDDLFFVVDVATLSSVKASKERVSDFEEGIKKLLSQVNTRLSSARAVRLAKRLNGETPMSA